MRYSHEGFVAEVLAAGRQIPVLMRALGFRLELIKIDVLHAVDQGVASHIAGNVTWVGTRKKFWSRGNQAANIDGLGAALAAYYKEHKNTSLIQGELSK